MLRYLQLFVPALLLLASCKPKPIEIEIPQQSGTLVISSACPNSNTVYVSASYSATSLYDLIDTNRNKNEQVIPKNLLLDSAIVVLHGIDGSNDTLQRMSVGLWGRSDLFLQAGTKYQLSVLDCKTGKTASSSTSFLPLVTIDTLYPERRQNSSDTLIKLHLRLKNATPGGYYFITHNTLREARSLATNFSMNKAMSLAPKQLSLLSSEKAKSGILDETINVPALSTDTLLVQVAEIDKACYDYLNAYKRSGSFINQLTGEPINLPGNITGALGLFSLYQPVYRMYDLKKF